MQEQIAALTDDEATALLTAIARGHEEGGEGFVTQGTAELATVLRDGLEVDAQAGANGWAHGSQGGSTREGSICSTTTKRTCAWQCGILRTLGGRWVMRTPSSAAALFQDATCYRKKPGPQRKDKR